MRRHTLFFYVREVDVRAVLVIASQLAPMTFLSLEVCVVLVEVIKVMAQQILNIEVFVELVVAELVSGDLVFSRLSWVFVVLLIVVAVSALVEERGVAVIQDLLAELPDLPHFFQEPTAVSILHSIRVFQLILISLCFRLLLRLLLLAIVLVLSFLLRGCHLDGLIEPS
jgi:hypothetical protein